MGRSPDVDDAARRLDGSPALSLIVAVDAVHAGTARSLNDILKAVRNAPCEVIVASREAWPNLT